MTFPTDANLDLTDIDDLPEMAEVEDIQTASMKVVGDERSRPLESQTSWTDYSDQQVMREPNQSSHSSLDGFSPAEIHGHLLARAHKNTDGALSMLTEAVACLSVVDGSRPYQKVLREVSQMLTEIEQRG